MTGSGDDIPPAPPQAASAPPRATFAIPNLFASLRRLPARALVFFRRYRWHLALLGPACAYLMITAGLLFHATGVLLALVVTALLSTFGTRVPVDTMLSLYRAEPVAPGQAQGLRAAIEALSLRAGLPTEPALAIIPSLAVGAFSAGGGSRVALFMTEGLLRRLGLRDLVAIAAHEIGHIRNGDLAVFALADSLTRVAQLLFYSGALLVMAGLLLWLSGEPAIGLLPILLLLMAPALNSQLQFALPRDHDLEADRAAAMWLGDAHAVTHAAALLDPGRGSPQDDFRLPVPQRRSPLPSPLRCPPDIETRISALASRPPAVLLPPLAIPDEPMISLLGFGPVEMRPRNRWPGLWF